MSKKERIEFGLMTIAEVARAADVLRSTIRYYTEMGLLKVAGTFFTKGYRLYNCNETVERIQRIRTIQHQNHTLVDIKNRVRFA